MKKLRQLHHVFFVNLALCDFGVMIMDVFVLLGAIYGREFYLERPMLCEINGFICMISCFGSLWTMMFIAINRLTSIWALHEKFRMLHKSMDESFSETLKKSRMLLENSHKVCLRLKMIFKSCFQHGKLLKILHNSLLPCRISFQSYRCIERIAFWIFGTQKMLIALWSSIKARTLGDLKDMKKGNDFLSVLAKTTRKNLLKMSKYSNL